jgi:hypothetical protein
MGARSASHERRFLNVDQLTKFIQTREAKRRNLKKKKIGETALGGFCRWQYVNANSMGIQTQTSIIDFGFTRHFVRNTFYVEFVLKPYYTNLFWHWFSFHVSCWHLSNTMPNIMNEVMEDPRAPTKQFQHTIGSHRTWANYILKFVVSVCACRSVCVCALLYESVRKLSLDIV